jgi:hypothetical protein
VSKINRAGQSGSLGNVDIPQSGFRAQIDALTDAVRQLGGNPEIAAGAGVVNDPLSAPYILYVNSYTGSDTFVAGDYASADNGTFEQKVRRISLQRLECGYTEARPFKTINRAVIEAGIITSRDYLTLGPICGDLVTIVVMSGMHEALNGPGLENLTANFPTWSANKVPTTQELQSFNPYNGSGIILPRGCSLVSLDLRKTNITPSYVPSIADEAANYSNRAAIFRVTGTGYYYGFTFLDKRDYLESHHLLDCFAFAGSARTDEFYSKIFKAFGAVAGISEALTQTRNSEVQIVGPAPSPGLQTEATDTVNSASPYIYNCSIRSTYGLCGIFANGADVTGFKSMVVAQFTGVSLQKDMRCWQVYNAGNWSNYTYGDYEDYIDEAPDNVRMDPNRRSFHVRAINRAIIQEVSVFAIGQGVHHWVESGGELTVTNSNSNFGGCASVAEGFISETFETDTNWNIASINVARDISGLANKWQRYDIGTLAESVSNSATTITLTANLEGGIDNKPTVLERNGYSLSNYGGTSYIWIENPNGVDYYAPLAGVAWDPLNPNKIVVSAAFLSADNDTLPSSDPTGPFPPIAGKRIYVRRLQDVRTLQERSYSITCYNTDSNSRNIIRDYGLQPDTSSAAIDFEIDAEEPIVVGSVSVTPATEAGVFRSNKIELRRAAASAAWDNRGAYRSGYHATYNYYRPGDIVRYQNKHFKCLSEHVATTTFETGKWEDCLVHTKSTFAAEDYFKNAKPVLIFDKDLDKTGLDSKLGYTNAMLDTDAELMRQYRTAVDYLGVYSLLRSLGFSDGDAHTILLPRDISTRERNPGSALDGISPPSGAANAWDNWSIQFRRPSNIRLFGHAFEWAGALNYTKSLPQYQKDLTASNKFSYYFTNSLGGRVYVSGFNEEGFAVSAAGLTDLQTGEVLSPEGLGSDEIDTNAPTVFNGDVRVNGTLYANAIESVQAALVYLLDDNRNELSQGRGMGWIAPAQAITGMTAANKLAQAIQFNESNQSGTALGPTSIGNQGYSGPHFVTPYFLDLWKAQNSLLGSVPGPVRIFVNPRAVAPLGDYPNSQNNESSNYNATISDLITRPPTSAGTAVTSLSLAIEYANLAIATTTQVEYYCGAGIYHYDAYTLTFEHTVRIISYSFVDNNLLANGSASGSKPFLGTTNQGRGPNNDGRNALTGIALENYVRDADNHPVFLTKIEYISVNNGTQDFIYIRPTQFNFKQDATIQGIVWWGLTTTLQQATGTKTASNKLVPNSWFNTGGNIISNASLQTVNQQSKEEIVNAFVYQIMSGRTGNISYLKTEAVIVTNGILRMRENAITAPGFPRFNLGANDDGAVITCNSDGVMQISGLYLIGNNLLDNTGYTGQGAIGTPQFFGATSYTQYGFAPCLFSAGQNSANGIVTFEFCGYGEPIQLEPSDWVRNTTFFNWHLMTWNYEYMSDSDTAYGGTPTTSFNLNGPGFAHIVGPLARERRTVRDTFTDFRTTSDNRKSGFAGNFGRYQIQLSNDTTSGTWRMTGLSNLSNDAANSSIEGVGNMNASISGGTSFLYQQRSLFFRKNGTAMQTVTSPSLTVPLIIQNAPTFGPTSAQLNIKYALIKRGVDYQANYMANRPLLG